MEYRIPKTTIRSFIDFLRNVKMNLIKMRQLEKIEQLEDRDYANNSSFNSSSLALEDTKTEKMQMIDELIKSTDDLIHAYENNDFSKYISHFNAIAAAISTNSEFVMMLILDIIKNNARLSKEAKVSDFNSQVEGILVSCLDGYKIKTSNLEDNKNRFIESYRKYLQSGRAVTDSLSNMATKPEVIDEQVGFMVESLAVLPEKLASLNKPKEKEPIVSPSNTSVYTKENPIDYYIKGSVVKHLCEPKAFNELLKQNGYADNARYSLVKQMTKSLERCESEERDMLISEVLKTIDSKYAKMWKYICENKIYFGFDWLQQFYDLFYTVPGIDAGYGYTWSDINEFMVAELEYVYLHMGGTLDQNGMPTNSGATVLSADSVAEKIRNARVIKRVR